MALGVGRVSVCHSEAPMCFCRVEAQFVAKRVVRLGVALGIGTAAFLAVTSPFLPRLFTPDQTILSAIAVIFPWYAVHKSFLF